MGVVDGGERGRGLSRLDANRASARDIECVLCMPVRARNAHETRDYI